MAKYTATYLADVRSQLQGAKPWSDTEIDAHVQTAIREFSGFIPYEQESVLPVVDDDKEVDISSLDGLVYIRDIEFYVDRSTRKWRNGRRWGDYLTLDIDFDPDVEESTLTGTVTFAATVNVTGSGTAFEDEVEAGDYIQNSADTEWAKVRSITDDDNLVLTRAYAGTTGADTVSLTPIRDYKEVVRIFWGGMHSVTAIATTIPTQHEQLIIDGATAYTLIGFAKLGREKILEAAQYLAVGDDYINKVTHGDNVPGGYSAYSGAELSAAALVLQYREEGWTRLGLFRAALRRNRTQRSFKTHSREA